MPEKAKECLLVRDLLEPVERIAKEHHVTLDEVLGRDRHAHVARARHECWFYLRGEGLSFPSIARLWGVNHTSIMSGVARAFTRRVAAP